MLYLPASGQLQGTRGTGHHTLGFAGAQVALDRLFKTRVDTHHTDGAIALA